MAAIRQKCCHETGFCFMDENHPRLEDFDGHHGTIPARKIQGTDIDYCTEVDGYVLFREFKAHYDMKWGQEKTLTTICDNAPLKHVLMVIIGDSAKGHAEAYRQYFLRKWTPWVSCTWHEAIAKSQAFMIEAKAREREIVLAKRAGMNALARPFAA
ncbi:hypothetical protein QBK99_19215 [Corticibacterium sp. UT-5YL-CI-8]|nr:hypothetical protein [Tianweitania sp. UT-5YL-CI-8]